MEMSVGERLRKNRACVKVVEVVTLFRDEPSLEKSTRLMKCQLVVPSTLRETNSRAMPFESVDLVSMKKNKVKHAISNELCHILFSCEHNCVFRGNREPSRVPKNLYFELSEKQDQNTEGICL